MRYIELNPVRADMAGHPAEYRWSSYRTNALGESDQLINPHPVYLAIDCDDLSRRQAYCELFRAGMSQQSIREVRQALNHELVLGRSSFKGQIELETRRQATLGKPGRPRANARPES
jgi:putative transposase